MLVDVCGNKQAKHRHHYPKWFLKLEVHAEQMYSNRVTLIGLSAPVPNVKIFAATRFQVLKDCGL